MKETTNPATEHLFKRRLAQQLHRNLGTAPTVEQILEYLVDHNIIPPHIITRWVILELYPERFATLGSKRQAVLDISDTVPLEERQIYYIVERERRRFWRRRKNGAQLHNTEEEE